MHCSTGAHSILDQGTCDYSNILNGSDNMTIKSPTRKKSTYRHIPHSEKPPHLVARRNARERKRVQAVNNAFLKLKKHVPFENNHKRLSKVKTLQSAIDYIANLQYMIEDYDKKIQASSNYGQRMPLVQYQGFRHQEHRGDSTTGTHCTWISEENISNKVNEYCFKIWFRNNL